MRRLATLVLSCSMLPLALHADDASKRAKVEEMLTLSKVDTISQQMLASVPSRIRAMASRQPDVENASTPEQKKLTEDYLQQMTDIAQKGAVWSTVHPKLIDLYMQAFTEPELDSIVAFYKTPAGQALVAKTAELSGKTVELLQSTVAAMQPDFKAATLAYQTSMKNTAPAPAQAAPTLGPATPAPATSPTLKPRQ